MRGGPRDYKNRHPEPQDIGLIVEVAKTSVQADRESRRAGIMLGAVGIPVYWIVNVDDRQLEVYADPSPRSESGEAGVYPAPTILGESASVELVLGGSRRAGIGRIAVADLLP